jgi:hypothetical protein
MAKLFAIGILCVFVTGFTIAQTVVTDELVQQFDKYRKAGLQEKIYVHTDKNFYVAGEIIWLKLYNVDAAFNKPIDISKVAYTEILDSKNKPVLQAKIALEKGSGNGSLFIPVDVPSGNYKLRAYTNWMKNFGASYFFEKTITVINTQEITELPKQKTPEKYTVQFFPEGGQLVSGLQSKVAFIITSKDGKGVSAEGIIKDNQNNTVAQFATIQNGMGNFMLKPISSNTYTAEIRLKNGTNISQVLPTVNIIGYVMAVANNGANKINIIVQLANETAQKEPTVYLFAHTKNSIKAIEKLAVQNGVASITIDENILGDGISHFTVFNSAKQPVCERLYFKYPAEKLDVKISPDKPVYSTRDKIDLSISAIINNGKNDSVNMSLAVYRLDSLQQPEAGGIADYLLLSSDLTGKIETPEYYFSDTTAAVKSAMDNLMLVNGWRRFKWVDILQNKKPYFSFVPEYNGHRITGKVVDNISGLAKPEITGYLSVPSVRTQFRNAVSDSTGRIMFELKDFYGTPGIIVQTNTAEDSNYHIEIDNPFYNNYSDKPIPAFSFPAKNPATLLDRNLAMQVQNIYTGKKQNFFIDNREDSMAFYYHPNGKYPLDDYTRFTTVEEIFREYVLQVNVRNRGGKFHLPMLNDVTQNQLFSNDPLLLLDGMPIFDINKLMAYDPLKMRKLELVSRQYFYGNKTYDGIINFVTYKGDMPGYELDPRTTVIDYEALQLEREFYSPVYDGEQPVDGHLPDFRSTLFWAPHVKTDMNGKAAISFYSGDLQGKFVAVIQAINKNGKMGSTSTFFEVR